MELSIMMPTFEEEGNIYKLVKDVKKVANQVTKSNEIIVMDGKSGDRTVEMAKKAGAKVYIRSRSDFSTFLKEGLPRCRGKYVITLDSDYSHPPTYIRNLWSKRKDADIIICSKWVPGGRADMSPFRILVSRVFNAIYKTILSTGVNDMNSNYRLYRKSLLKGMKMESRGADVLSEILIRSMNKNARIIEIPFHYMPRKFGVTKFKPMSDSIKYLKTLLYLRKIRRPAV